MLYTYIKSFSLEGFNIELFGLNIVLAGEPRIASIACYDEYNNVRLRQKDTSVE